MSSAAEITVTMRDGTKKTMSMPAGHGDGSVDMATLLSSLTKLRDQSNTLLTEMVNNEKAAATGQNNNTKGHSADDDEDDEEGEGDDDDDDEGDDGKDDGKKRNSTTPDGEPTSKKPKT